MVIWSSSLFILGNIPYTIEYVRRLFGLDYNPLFYNISLDILFLSHGMNIFIFFAFNKLYRNTLTRYVRFFFIK